eukprot:jgi/Ulvmu1/6111/UM027_0089.1
MAVPAPLCSSGNLCQMLVAVLVLRAAVAVTCWLTRRSLTLLCFGGAAWLLLVYSAHWLAVIRMRQRLLALPGSRATAARSCTDLERVPLALESLCPGKT